MAPNTPLIARPRGAPPLSLGSFPEVFAFQLCGKRAITGEVYNPMPVWHNPGNLGCRKGPSRILPLALLNPDVGLPNGMRHRSLSEMMPLCSSWVRQLRMLSDWFTL